MAPIAASRWIFLNSISTPHRRSLACPGFTGITSVIGGVGFTAADYEKETFSPHGACPHWTPIFIGQ
jgi:hypothetical protein